MSAPSRCRCCEGTRIRALGTKRGTYLARDFEFFHCTDCDFRFVEPFAGYEIYNDDYYRGAGPDPFVDYESEYRNPRGTPRLLEFDDLARLVEQALAGRTAAVHWLDLGCGAGGLLKYLRDRGTLDTGAAGAPIHVSGHDVGTYARRLRDDDGFRILSFDGLAAQASASFDIVTMIEVIEHVREPADLIKLAARLLNPGGLLVLTTGNLDCAVARRQGLAFGYCMPEIHVSLFTPKTLAFLYQRYGLSPRYVRYRGVTKFKVLKTLRDPRRQRIARTLLRLPGVVRLIDRMYGVSAMPWAVKQPEIATA